MKKQTEVDEMKVKLDDMADHVSRVAVLGRAIKNSRLKEKTVHVLVSHYTKLPQHVVKAVLDALPELERTYLK